MTKSPYFAMIGATVGFFLGVLVIMLLTADFSLDNIMNLPNDGVSLLSMQLRVIIIAICILVGVLVGFSSGFVFNDEKAPGK